MTVRPINQLCTIYIKEKENNTRLTEALKKYDEILQHKASKVGQKIEREICYRSTKITDKRSNTESIKKITKRYAESVIHSRVIVIHI